MDFEKLAENHTIWENLKELVGGLVGVRRKIENSEESNGRKLRD